MNLLKICTIILLTGFVYACTSATQTNTVSNTAVTTNTQQSPSASQPTASSNSAEVVTGRKLYMDNCAACHKENGTGGKMEIEGKRINPDNLTSSKIKAFTDEKITRYIVNGVPDEGMPAFKDKLNEAQIAEIVEFVRSDIQKQLPGESGSSNQSR